MRELDEVGVVDATLREAQDGRPGADRSARGIALDERVALERGDRREAVLLGRSVIRASSPRVVGWSCSNTSTSSCAARSMAWDPLGRVRSS